MVLELDEICGADPEEENQTQDGPFLNSGSPPDLKPEFCQYQDEGCRHAPSCLECPFPRCLFEAKQGRRHLKKENRNLRILRLYVSGKTVKYLADRFKLTERMVEIIVKEIPRQKRSLNE